MNLRVRDFERSETGVSFIDEEDRRWCGDYICNEPADGNSLRFRSRLTDGPADMIDKTVDIAFWLTESTANVSVIG